MLIQKAYPLADAKLTKDILELVHQAQNYVKFWCFFFWNYSKNIVFFFCLFSRDNYVKVLMKQLKH